MLESALRVSNIALVRNAEGYRLVPTNEAIASGRLDVAADGRTPQAGYGVSAVPLRYSSAATTTKLLENFATKQGAIRVDAAHNMILIQGTGPERPTAVETVLSFDTDWMRGVSTASATGTQRNPKQDAQRHSVARSTSQLSRQRIFPSEQDDGTHRTHHFHPAADHLRSGRRPSGRGRKLKNRIGEISPRSPFGTVPASAR